MSAPRNSRDPECWSWQELARYNEKQTGIPCPDQNAPAETYYQWFVAQLVMLMRLKHENQNDADKEALEYLKNHPRFERLSPYIEKALGPLDSEPRVRA